ncbi:MAG TPA: hypothetical protein VM010_03795 [Chitinophagaceae bacterium]|nr:hypothetical protein [Chitinophagaceae bacterium]
MNSNNAIQQELKDLRSSLPLDDREQPVFSVPDGYFENFAASVWAKLESQQVADKAGDELSTLSPLLAAIPKHTPYHVPENYFEHLATNLPAFANDEALPELLQTHTKQMPYTVPNGYFDGLAAQVTAKLKAPKAKVVSMYARFQRMAIAAALTGAVALGIFYVAGRGKTIDPAKQPDAWIAQKLKNIPNQDLDAFLKNTDASFTNTGLAKNSDADVRQMLHDVSTPELDAFLAELPTETESSTLN